MRQRSLITMLVAAVGVLLLGIVSLGQGTYDANWHTVDGGGGVSTGSTFTVRGTVGQPDAGVGSGGSYRVVHGYWSGAGFLPTAVTLAGFWVEARGDALVVFWETATEIDLLGFHLYRSDTGAAGSFGRLNEGLIPDRAPGSPVGANYEWVDTEVEAGQPYFYLLEDVDVHGQATLHGPVSAILQPIAPYRIYLPRVNRTIVINP